ncbi:MAG: alginate export family protein [Verrucomicrobiota bacterium]
MGIGLLALAGMMPGVLTGGEMIEASWSKAPVGKEPIAEIPDAEPWIKPTADVRFRYEYGDQEGRRPSNALTARGRFGLLTKKVSGFQLFAEYEGTLTPEREWYRGASVNGPADRTVIADPPSHELNQLWLSFDGIEGINSKVGRQGINIDNQRYIGTVAWRQNMQTFDAAGLTLSPFEDFEIYYAFINRVERIFGSGDIRNPAQTDFTGNSHVVHLAYGGLPFGTLKVFAYFLDLHNRAGDANSNNSFGASLTGPLFLEDLSYYLEYGYQTNAFDSPLDYSANYFHAVLTQGGILDAFTGTVGYEYLGSDNGVGYKFPLATLHKFNGFADVFLSTPPDGLQDVYVTLGTKKLPWGIGLTGFYHFFFNDSGDKLGGEIDVVLTKDLPYGLKFLAKYANFKSDDPRFRDIQRATAQVEWKY